MKQPPFVITDPPAQWPVDAPGTVVQRRAVVPLWLVAALLFTSILLCPERPAWGETALTECAVTSTTESTAARPDICTMIQEVARPLMTSRGFWVLASAAEISGIALLSSLCILTMMYGLRLVLRSVTTDSTQNPMIPIRSSGQADR